MKLIQISVGESEFLEIRDFLVSSYAKYPAQNNWLIDRWNFCRYFSQPMNGTYTTWLNTVGLWKDENGEITAVVNSEGENCGEAFFQIGNVDETDELYNILLDHAETHLYSKDDKGRFINLRVNYDSHILKETLLKRNYTKLDWQETCLRLNLVSNRKVDPVSGLRLTDANIVTDSQKAVAHAKAFGYYKNGIPEDLDPEGAFRLIRLSKDYREDLDLAFVTDNGEVAAFASVWYDAENGIGILEPVGTIPEHRRKGLGKALIYEAINRLCNLHAETLFVGSDQMFYKSIGFTEYYSKEVWQKRFD